MGLADAAATGFAIGNTNPLTDVIRGILADARAKGLIETRGDANIDLVNAQADANIRLASAKNDFAPKTRGAFEIVDGVAVPVKNEAGDLFQGGLKDRIITPSEGATEGERAAKSAKGKLKAQMFEQMLADSKAGIADTNIIQDSAGSAQGSATPVSDIVGRQQQAAPQQAPARSPEEEELIRLLEQLGG